MSGRDPAELAVDVVIDNYNYAAFLPAAIESALAQTHERVRVIVVDDGSTDDSADVLRGYEDRVTVVLKENGGHASAFNAGFERCEGDIVIYLDADDLLRPEAAAEAAAAFAADERVVKTQSRMEVVDAEGGSTGLVKPPPHIPMPNGDVCAEELSQPFDLPWVPTSANAFSREAMRKVMPIPEDEYRMCAERYLVHLLPLLGRVNSLDHVGACYRVHGDNAYESLNPQLNMDRLRLTIRVERSTAKGLLELAAREGIPHPDRILSIADLANRMISLRLEPELHPVPEDTRTGLVREALAAARRRSNASAPMKAIFAGWFAAMAIVPRPLARRLATYFLFPERRPAINKLLGRFQRS
ncbi:MAG: glycosyltransferase [Actinomycetota bacterium]|nr:glycosyltransferase [Actinomycetota bacterium]